MRHIHYFDLETQKSADEVGGWDRISEMRMSVGVTYSTARGDYRIYGEPKVNELIEELRRADLVVGYNIQRFDYEVLAGHNDFFDPEQIPTLDMLVELNKQLPFRPKLDDVGTATLGVEKTSEGMQAIRWFREGKLLEIAEYRVPTDSGYRFYVDTLTADKSDIDTELASELIGKLELIRTDVNSFLDNASRMLSELSHYIGISVSPNTYQTTLSIIELVPYRKNQIAVMLITDEAVIRNKIVSVEQETSREDLNRLGRLYQ